MRVCFFNVRIEVQVMEKLYECGKNINNTMYLILCNKITIHLILHVDIEELLVQWYYFTICFSSFFPPILHIFLSCSPLPFFFSIWNVHRYWNNISIIHNIGCLSTVWGVRTNSFWNLLLTFLSVNPTNILKQISFGITILTINTYDNNLFHLCYTC